MQAERESSEVEERPTEPFMVNPKFLTEDLLNEAELRLDAVRGFLDLLSCGQIGGDIGMEAIQEAAFGVAKMTEEVKALQDEYSSRIWERERPRREAAEKRRTKAQMRERCVRMFAKLEVDKGADKATARRLAKATVAELEAEGPLSVEAAPAKSGNGGAQ